MKKTSLILLIIFTFAAMSCTEDYSDPKVLSGTTWRYSSPIKSSSEYWEYIELQFISTSQVAIWYKPRNGSAFKQDGLISYTISNKTITISFAITTTGVIEGKKMTLLIDGLTCVFTKQ